MHRQAILWALTAVFMMAATTARAVDLVVDGAPAATIVISAEALEAAPLAPRRGATGTPAEKIRLAADDLQHYIQRITGAKLPIVAAGQPVEGAAILVGASSATANINGLDLPAGVTKTRDDEASILYCDGDLLVLAGNDDGPYHGTHNAVSLYLESLGVRWFIPGEFGEVVPQMKTIRCAALNRVEKPSFRFRTWWCNEPKDMGEVHALWRLRNRMQLADMQVIAIAGDSWLRKYMPDEKLIEEKPELFGKKFDQSPDPHMPNLSNPDAARVVAEKVIAELKQRKEKGNPLDSVGFAPDDGLPMDHTPETMKTLNQGFVDWIGREGVPTGLSTTEEWMTFVNRVTEHVNAEIPGTIIATNGYANRTNPPVGFKLHPNIAIMFASIWADALKPMSYEGSWQSRVRGAQLKRWCELSDYVYLYDYMNYMLVSLQTPIPQVRKLFSDFRDYHDWGVIGFFNEACLPWMEPGILTRYSRAKLMWNAHLDYETHVADYYTKWYGPAAVPARAFWDEIEDCVLHTPLLGHEDRILAYTYTPRLIEQVAEHLAAAESAAKAEPFATRVRVDRLLFEHLKAYVALRAAEFDARYADCVAQLDLMHDARMKLHEISPFMAQPAATTGRERYYSGEWYYGLLQRRAHFEKLAAMNANLVALAPRHAQFKLDPAGMGKDLRWFDPSHDRRDWQIIDSTRPYYLQGHMTDDGIPYDGRMWYVFEVDVPASAEGKPVQLYSPIVTSEAWVWVNGEYVGHRGYLEGYIRPAAIDFDVTDHVRPGQRNTIGVWISSGGSPAQAPEGFMGRLLLHTPTE